MKVVVVLIVVEPYCTCVADFIRHPTQVSQQFDLIRHLPPQSLIPMFDGVNVVSSCAWAVNKPVRFLHVF